MKWERSWKADPEVRPLADRHYNRHKVGAAQFVPPGRALVLRARVGCAVGAFWISAWPFARFVRHRWAGAWTCTAYRREIDFGVRSSELIREAIAATRWYFGEPPEQGFLTFVDESKVTHKRDPGRCFLRAGFEPAGRSADANLLAFVMPVAAMPAALPALGMNERHRDARLAA